MLRRILPACTAALLLAVYPLRAQTPPDARAVEAEVRQRAEAAIKALPPLEVRRLHDLVRVRLEDGRLVCHFPLYDGPDPPKGQYRLAVEGLGLGESSLAHFTRAGTREYRPGMASVNLPISMADIGSRRHWPGTLVCLQEPVADGVLNTITVSADYKTQKNRVILQRTTRLPDGAFGYVEFVQEGPEGDRPGRVRLTAVDPPYQDFPKPDRPVTTAETPDFPTFVREHRPELDRFLRPLLRRLDSEPLLAPDPLLAWQVLADGWKPDAAAAEAGRRVRELLPGLADHDYRRRKAAAEAIERLGRPGAEVLLHLDRAGLTAQQNLAIDRMLAPYNLLAPEEVTRLRGDVGFLLDCLYCPDRALRVAGLEQLRKVARTASGVNFDADAPEADRTAAVAALRERLLTGALSCSRPSHSPGRETLNASPLLPAPAVLARPGDPQVRRLRRRRGCGEGEAE